MRRPQEMSPDPEEIQHEAMHGQESLCLPGRVDPAQVSRAVPCGLVGDVGTTVLVSLLALGDGWQDRSVCSSVAAQRVGDHPPRRTRLPLQQRAKQACHRPTVATRLDEAIERTSPSWSTARQRERRCLWRVMKSSSRGPNVVQPALSTREPARVY